LSVNVPHPTGGLIENVSLMLTERDGATTLANVAVTRSDLWARIVAIKGRWPYADASERNTLWTEIATIKSRWPYAPTQGR
jgi:hypothetical protein